MSKVRSLKLPTKCTTLMLLCSVALIAESFYNNHCNTISSVHGFVIPTTRTNYPLPSSTLSYRYNNHPACCWLKVTPSTMSAWCVSSLLMAPTPMDEDTSGSDDGAALASELFKLAQRKGISLNSDDLDYDDEDDEDTKDDDDEEDDEPEINYPQGAINAFLGYDTGDVGEKLAGNVTLTNDQIFSEVKDRVLESAGAFLELVKPASEEDDEDDDSDSDLVVKEEQPKPYAPPETVPDSELTAGEVVMQVLDSLLHNDVPTKNKGVEILFGYSSDGSQIKNEIGLTPADYADFLKETEYKVLFDHMGASIDKADYSFDGKKAFFTARLRTGSGPLDTVSVNFILSTTGVEDDACWLIDSMLIRPQSMRRRRRR